MSEGADRTSRSRLRRLLPAAGALVGLGLLALAVLRFVLPAADSSSAPAPAADTLGKRLFLGPQALMRSERITVWWDLLPAALQARTRATGIDSNVRPADYAGPEACKQCHSAKYDAWSKHPHRWMNALAGEQTVLGDFTGVSINYRGGQATFYRDGAQYRMRLERDGVRRVYRVTQTIGSRFFQYYVGRLDEGPEPPDHVFYRQDHVLWFGFWLEPKEWVPTVHIGPEEPDADRPDPFAPPANGRFYAEYAASCNHCHTTFALGDLLSRAPTQMGEHAPRAMHWSVRSYLADAHPAELPTMVAQMRQRAAHNPMTTWDAPHYAVTLGVSCEACHLGARAHVASQGTVPPKFYPSSPHLAVPSDGKPLDFGRTHDNVNWACGRCHTGTRPTYAAGMSTWNSVEYADAMRGSCYSQLRCIDCHEPHRATGVKWTRTPDQDDAACLRCHDKFSRAVERTAHTHHPLGSEGSRCLNCHMPRLNEGLQDLVRTHMIFSPTRADMIEANHPNACNQCHTEQPIDWTVRHLQEWYGTRFDEARLAAAYPDRRTPVAVGWLASPNEAVRLVGIDSLTRAQDARRLPQLLEALDDAYLINRQFAARQLAARMGTPLAKHGYRFYLTAAERRGPMAALRKAFCRASP